MFMVHAFIGCVNSNAQINTAIEAFVNEIDRALRVNSDEKKEIKVDLPNNVNGYLILSSPYAISENDSDLIMKVGKSTSEQLAKLTQDDSAFHLFIVNQKRILKHKKWPSPPVVFNDLFYVKLSSNKKHIKYIIKNKKLEKVI